MSESQLADQGENLSDLSEARKKIVARLSRIEGHVRGVSRMVRADRSCADVLTQLAAVRAAVDSVSHIVLTNHVETCLRRAVDEGSVEEVWDPLRKALELYIKA
jgi:DNA-binding FrmR family transcriptional regulator